MRLPPFRLAALLLLLAPLAAYGSGRHLPDPS